MGGVQACPGGLCGSNELRLVAVAQFLTDFHLERATGCLTLPSVGCAGGLAAWVTPSGSQSDWGVFGNLEVHSQVFVEFLE